MAETISRKPSSKTVRQGNWYDLSILGVLARELERLKREDVELVLPLILRSGIIRVSDYISKSGKKGMAALLNAAKWVDPPNASSVRVRNFKSYEDLMINFQLNQNNLGEVWYRKWQRLKDENEYLKILRRIIASPLSYKIVWNAPSLFGVKPRLGYLFREDGQKPILVVINQDGFIEKGEVINGIWKDILTEMDNFYKIDDFPDTLLAQA